MNKILAITSIRSDYDLMSGLYSLLNKDKHTDLRLLVSGAHLSKAYGFTVEDIRKDNIKILAEIESLINSDSLSSRLKTASCFLGSSIDIVKQFSPDLILYAGDREDVLIGSMLGCFFNIPTIHFFGGDHASDGHIDNPIRHATSKLSSLHFVSTEEHKKRLLSLGENSERIFVIGSVALDKFISEPFLEKKLLLEKISPKPHSKRSKLAVFIFHPIEEEKQIACDYVKNALKCLLDYGYHVFLGGTNTDPGNFALVGILEEYSQYPEVTYYKNINRNFFVNLLRHSELIIGNSSAGILEAASVPIPAINIGLRQKSRLAGKNVIFTEGDYKSIEKALIHVTDFSFKAEIEKSNNPYGDGQSVKKAYEIIKKLDCNSFIKKTEDPLYAR